MRGGLAIAELDKPVPQRPPAAKHTHMCLRPRLAKARMLLRGFMYRALALARRSPDIHSISSAIQHLLSYLQMA